MPALPGDTGKPASHEGAAVANDGAVLRAAARGDLTHFDAFVDRHKVVLLNYIHQRVHDAHRAEDLTQEVFLRAFQAAARGEYRGRADASAWLSVPPGAGRQGTQSSTVSTMASYCGRQCVPAPRM